MLDINELREILPHRFPMLLVDRIEELVPGKRIVGIKNVTINEEFFLGHYPEKPIMPGVLIIEAMAQVSGVLMLKSINENDANGVPLFASIDKARFRLPVVPGDQLRIEAEIVKLRSRVAKVEAKAFVKDDLVTEAKLMFAIEAE